jgi:hypothetical protein
MDGGLSVPAGKERRKMDRELLFNSYSESPFNKLSNFYPSGFIYKGNAYASAEHAYQAAKCALPQEAAMIKMSPDAVSAKKAAKKVILRQDWNDVKFTLMKEILRCKFYQNQELRQLLLSTKDTQLVHEAPWDAIWGNGKDGKGTNVLGKQLMEIRKEILDNINRSNTEREQ